MFQTPAFPSAQELIDQNIQQLESLCDLLSDEVKNGLVDNKLGPEALRCKEVLLTIQILLPKLRTVRAAQLPSHRQLEFGMWYSGFSQHFSSSLPGRRASVTRHYVRIRAQRAGTPIGNMDVLSKA